MQIILPPKAQLPSQRHRVPHQHMTVDRCKAPSLTPAHLLFPPISEIDTTTAPPIIQRIGNQKSDPNPIATIKILAKH
jgi:hypothetical protein